MTIFDTISNAIKEAMKAQDKVALATLRNIKKVLLEAKTAPGANDTVSDEAAIKIIQSFFDGIGMGANIVKMCLNIVP